MLIELIELQDKLKTTFVYVTHDQFEALTVADQMAIMNHQWSDRADRHPQRDLRVPRHLFCRQVRRNDQHS